MHNRKVWHCLLTQTSTYSREQHRNKYTIKGETDHQPRLDAWDKLSDLVLWEDLEGPGGEGGGRGDRDGEDIKKKKIIIIIICKYTDIVAVAKGHVFDFPCPGFILIFEEIISSHDLVITSWIPETQIHLGSGEVIKLFHANSIYWSDFYHNN